MHEMSLVRALFRQADRVIAEHSASKITAVRVAVGPLAGVEPDLFASAFVVFTAQNFPHEIELVVDQVGLTADCPRCQQVVELVDFIFRCPRCGSAEVRVVGGDALELVSVTLTQNNLVGEAVT